MSHPAGEEHVLVPLKEVDMMKIVEMFRGDPDSVHRAMPWLSRNEPIGPQIASFIVDVSSGPNASNYHHWLIRENVGGGYLGIIGFDVVRFRTPEQQRTRRGIHWNLGYWIAPEERGHGLATMSINAMISVARQCEVDVVELMADPRNEGGVRTILSAVERHDGFPSEVERWMTSDDGNDVLYVSYWISTGGIR